MVHSYSTPDPAKGYWEEGDEGWEFDCPVFVNLSNHRLESWSVEQLDYARRSLGIAEGGKLNFCIDDWRLYDIPFPVVDPKAWTHQIFRLADSIVRGLTEKLQNKQTIFHVMGEMTLTYSLISILHVFGYNNVVASTTERIAEEKDGQKVSSFRFVQFRKY
jgi:hypothetical protein